ncbi:MAG: PSD1 and planctomycete cytochrome C domain-containing protein, partial [Planctomycetota bacterium]|nr:PSD1 and planctomycete cytochrome C domain-containing protein [Planctomycetota bacterium]
MQHSPLCPTEPLPRSTCQSTLIFAVVGLLSIPLTAQAPSSSDFNRDIRPILAAKCFACHGPDKKSRKAKLRLDVATGALKARGKHPAVIIPGDSKASELVRRITHADPEERMPPRSVLKQLNAKEKQLIIDWIEQGADWEAHWAFITPTMPTVPRRGPSQNEIDALILGRLSQEGLRPSAAADRTTLIRRVSLDLIGLPPTPAEVADFVEDRAPGAFEKVVDRLLESPHYGEHMARFWLDAARYGDTHGLHLDNYREMWPYRDWVVKSFNDNMRFDQFTLQQIAGDMLPEPTLAQKVASGFNRCHVSTNEGGSIAEEVYVRNVVDRVSTIGTVFLGLSLGCAVCHDHKFDPIRQEEFYQFFAFFNNLDANPMDGNAKLHPPVVRVPTAEHTRQITALKNERAATEKQIVDLLAASHYREPPSPPVGDLKRETIVWVDDHLPAGSSPEGDGLVWVDAPSKFVHSGRRAMKRTSRGNQQHYFKDSNKSLRIANSDILFAWVYLDPSDKPREIMLQWNSDGNAGWHHRAYWGENLINYGKTGTTERHHMGPLPEFGKWIRLAVPVEKVGLHSGMEVRGIAFTQFDGTAYWDTAGIETTAKQEQQEFVWIDDSTPTGAKLQGNGAIWQFVVPKKPSSGVQPKVLSGKKSLRRKGTGLIQDVFSGVPRPLRVQAGDRLFAHVWLDPKDPPKSVQLQFNDGTWEHRVRWGAPAHGPGRKGGADYVAGKLPVTGKWVRLEVAIDKVNLAPGRMLNGWAFTQVDGTVWWDKAGVMTWGPPDDRHLRSLKAWEPIGKADNTVDKSIRNALAIDIAKRTTKQTNEIRNHYLQHVFAGSREVFEAPNAKVAALTKKVTDAEKQIPTTLVMKERSKPRDAYLLNRGLYDQRGKKVERATPSVLPPMNPALPRNRLGLAHWLIDPSNPLTARVTVNRLWQQVFGIGLVKTSEDFGNQGERPSHPRLLDWLATQFVAGGWDVKRFMKRMVMSATYRQSSTVSPELVRRDPDNRLLARGPRFRLDAETLRDQALALSGMLVSTVGGPGVKPTQPS